MRYFLTGGAGFIGSNFVEYLFENVQDLTGVTIFDKFTYAANSKNYEKYLTDPRLKVVKGDICDFFLLSKSMEDHDFVIHFAAESHVDRSIEDASVFIETNVLGTFNVLEAARKNNVKTVIHVSTDEVYGSLLEGSADETYPLLPNSPYAASKAASDLIARSYFVTHGLDVRTTRCCNNFGKYQFPEKIIPVAINSILNSKKIPIYGDGTNVREWIAVTKHCESIFAVLSHGKAGEIYNIGSGHSLSNFELAKLICKNMGVSEDMISYVKDRPGHDFRYSITSSKVFQLEEKTVNSFDQDIEEVIKWYINNSDWWTS